MELVIYLIIKKKVFYEKWIFNIYRKWNGLSIELERGYYGNL